MTVAGTAFVVVRCAPAYGYDFETGRTDLHRARSASPPTGTHHVREVVETGDFEGVLTWVIGLDAQRPFRVTRRRHGPPTRQLIVTFS